MFLNLYFLVVGLVGALLIVNFVFRARLLKLYRILVNARVDFQAKHIFDKSLMEKEIISKHPNMAKELRSFSQQIRNSIYIAAAIVVLITVLATVLSNYR